MINLIFKLVRYKIHDSVKSQGPFRGQRSTVCNFYLDWAITSQVIIVSSCYLVEMFTLICRRVKYDTHDSMLKVKITLRGQRSKLCNLNLVWADSSQVIVVLSYYLEMFTLTSRYVKTYDSMSNVKVTFFGDFSYLVGRNFLSDNKMCHI